MISIHAPTRGATEDGIYSITLEAFQSTLPREERQERGLDFFEVLRISIHAPTRGATVNGYGVTTAINQFQSTLPREERPVQTLPIHSKEIQFQSTLPREERRRSPELHTHPSDFNPRSHERSDAIAVLMDDETRISIHAPTRGATCTDGKGLYLPILFQSTLPREERQLLQLFTKQLFSISIHAPTRGATVLTLGFPTYMFYFNPRSHERSDIHIQFFLSKTPYFNPRSHERSDDSSLHFYIETPQFQSTLPREERQIQFKMLDV